MAKFSRTRLVITSLLSLAALFATSCQKRPATAPNQTSNAPSPSATIAPTSVSAPAEIRHFQGTGVVTKIVRENPLDKSLASVELNHNEIVGLMPAMIMEFYVKDVSMLDGLKVGDLVEFTIEEKGPTEIISAIKKK